MAWLAVDKDGQEYIYEEEPYRIEENGRTVNNKIDGSEWYFKPGSYYVKLPKDTIKKIIGKELTWNDKPVEIK